MIVSGVWHIKQRGPVATMTVDVDVDPAGASLRRSSDGASWPIRGVERFCKFLDRPKLGEAEKVGILLPWGADVKAGDVVEVVPATNENSPSKP
jgi:hypothetical protein